MLCKKALFCLQSATVTKHAASEASKDLAVAELAMHKQVTLMLNGLR